MRFLNKIIILFFAVTFVIGIGALSVCYALPSNTVVPHGHTEVIDAAIDPTCTDPGLTAGSHCSTCNTILSAQSVIPAHGHTEVTDAAVDPTCTDPGLTAGSHCAVCGKVFVAQQQVAKLPHVLVMDNAVDATCTSPGRTESEHCIECGTYIVTSNYIPALGHSYDLEGICMRCGKVSSGEYVLTEDFGYETGSLGYKVAVIFENEDIASYFNPAIDTIYYDGYGLTVVVSVSIDVPDMYISDCIIEFDGGTVCNENYIAINDGSQLLFLDGTYTFILDGDFLDNPEAYITFKFDVNYY